MNKTKGILSALDLAGYIKYKYSILETRVSDKISPLKLQKSLYFCFAYWGGFVRHGKNAKSELEISDSEYLFDDKIEAWVYGPVVPNVYYTNRDTEIELNDGKELFKDKRYVQEFLDEILTKLLNTSDFRLVEISHQDKCWERNFRKSEVLHNNEIPKEEIIEEYAKQI